MNNFYKGKIFPLFIILIIFILQFVLIRYVSFSINYIKLSPQSIFITDLFGTSVFLPTWIYYFCVGGSTLMIWLIVRNFFSGFWEVLPSFIFGICLWPIYLVSAESSSIVTLFLMLILIFSFMKWRNGHGSIWMVAIFVGALYYFSMLVSLTIFLAFIFIVATNYITKKQKTQLLFVILFMYLPVILGSLHNPAGFLNLIKQQIDIFSDPGLLNGLNNFKGESQLDGYYVLQKIVENKYIYLPKYILLKVLKHFNPSTYFTDNEKLLNFSFNSPIYFGFIIPFIYGIYKYLKNFNKEKFLLILFSLSLMIPSILSQKMINLHRLFLIMPVLIFFITKGILSLYNDRRFVTSKLLLCCMTILVIIQFGVSLIDLSHREYFRFRRYFGPVHMEVGKQ